VATVSVLYIDDDTVGPHLELLRNVCEPSSTSRPHVTVRYFDKLNSIREEHFGVNISCVDLIEPGDFAPDDAASGGHRTVYIRCESEELDALDYKPDYPRSELHITLYDGKSTEFAAALLQVVKTFDWGFRVRLPEDTTLKEIPIRTRRSRQVQTRREYSASVKALYKRLTCEHLTGPHLAALSDQQRLEIAYTVCEHLHQVAAQYQITTPAHSDQEAAVATAVEYNDRSLGIHGTPPELALDIAKYAVGLLDSRTSEIRFGDPSVGTGEFYRALRQVLPKERIVSAIGVEISPRQVAVAQRRWSPKQLTVKLGDYLHTERLPARTLILANPPYLRHQHIPREYKEELRQRTSVSMGMPVSALSGLYVYFLLLSHGWMEQGAVAAWLIPSEFMQTAYGAAVRHYLTHRVQLIRIHHFGPSVALFEKVTTMPCVVVFRNRQPSESDTAVLSYGGTLQQPLSEETVRIRELRGEARWSIPRAASCRARPSGVCIGDIFVVHRGIATGANKFFVMERGEAALRGIPEVALRPLLPKARTLTHDVVECDEDGYPRLEPQLCLLDCSLSEDEIGARFPRFMEYLETARETGVREGTLVRKRQLWYRQEQREPSPFLCTYMGRGRPGVPPIRFIWNKSAAVAVNTYLMLYPREALAKLLHKRPKLAAEVFALLQEIARETMSENWRVYAGGLRKIEPGDLRRVRLSSTPAWLDGALDRSLPLKQAGD